MKRLQRLTWEGSARSVFVNDYVCTRCQRQLLQATPTAPRLVRHASTGLLGRFRKSSSDSEATAAPRSLLPSILRRDDRALEEEGEEEEYSPAETWDNLRRLGHTGHWTDTAENEADSFRPWHMPRQAHHERLPSHLHQAVVECLSQREKGLDPDSACEIEAHEYPVHAQGILVDAEGYIMGLQPNVSDTQAHVESLPEIQDASATSPSSQTIQSLLSAKLQPADPITFSIFKRFSQLSGRILPDPILGKFLQASTPQPIAAFLEVLLEETRPKPKNVSEKLMQNATVTETANLKIRKKRETMVDREQEVGRWLVIQRELLRRGLPVLGKDGQTTIEEGRGRTT